MPPSADCGAASTRPDTPRKVRLRWLQLGLLALVLVGATGCAGDVVLSPAGPIANGPVDWFGRARSLFGLFMMLGIAWLMSVDRARINYRLVIGGVGLQVILAFVTLSPPGRVVFGGVNKGVSQILAYTEEGASFLFGDLARYGTLPVSESVLPPPGPGATPEAVTAWLERAKRRPVKSPPGAETKFVGVGAYVAFGILPTIIFFSSLMAVLYYLGVMQQLVRGLAWLMQRTMKTSGAETLSAAGNIFVGQTEAPLLIHPFIKDMTNSELMAVMTGGFATVAGGVMVAFVALLSSVFPDIAGHLLCASIMSAPAALVVAKIMVPEPDPTASKTYGSLKVELPITDANVIDAAARGASEGLRLALNVGAMLLSFTCLIALINGIVGAVGGLIAPAVGLEGAITLQRIFGWVLQPVAWCMGVPWQDAGVVGGLMGVKTVINEFIAYMMLADVAPNFVSHRSMIISTYALCGFANFASIAIQLGGISPLAPERRGDLARLGLRAMIGGTLAAFMTACVIGTMI